MCRPAKVVTDVWFHDGDILLSKGFQHFSLCQGVTYVWFHGVYILSLCYNYLFLLHLFFTAIHRILAADPALDFIDHVSEGCLECRANADMAPSELVVEVKPQTRQRRDRLRSEMSRGMRDAESDSEITGMAGIGGDGSTVEKENKPAGFLSSMRAVCLSYGFFIQCTFLYSNFIFLYSNFTFLYSNFIFLYSNFIFLYSNFTFLYNNFLFLYSNFIFLYSNFIFLYNNFTFLYSNFIFLYSNFTFLYSNFTFRYSNFIFLYSNFIFL